MSGSVAAAWVIPIVAFIALFAWIGGVLYADAHPRYKHQSSLPRTEVAGGAFQALDGGRQLMPIPMESNTWPDGRLVQPEDIPAQRTAMSPEEVAAATGAAATGAAATGQAQPQETAGQPAAEERHLIPGSKIRLAAAGTCAGAVTYSRPVLRGIESRRCS